MERTAEVSANQAQVVSHGKSALVSVSTLTSLVKLPQLVSVLVNLGASASVQLRGGAHESIRSVITRLNEKTEILSAAITLRGDRAAR